MKSAAADSSVGIRVRTHAKLNLFLRVIGRRPDGYHEIESIFHGVSLADEIDIRRAEGDAVDVVMHGGAGSPLEEIELETNLAYLAARSLIERGITSTGLLIEVNKNIPVGGGLGGGSSNAAGVLVALNELWGAGLGSEDLNAVGASVGSDVPYCLVGGTMLATARGEKLTSLPSPADLHVVLGISDRPLLTKDVYERWDHLGAEPGDGSASMTLALGAGDPVEVGQLLHNDLEPAAFSLRPELQASKDELLEAGALGAAVTGSGPTLFGIARDAEHAQEIAARVKGHFDRVEVADTARRCVERLD
jgi:4-diphosphocytidyl-2-C-methyl-D-erythritol kinase